MCEFVHFQNYAESLCRSFCDLLKDITNEGQVQVLKVLTHAHAQLYYFFRLLSQASFVILLPSVEQ